MLSDVDFVACSGVTETGTGVFRGSEIQKGSPLAITLMSLLLPLSLRACKAQKKNFWDHWEVSFAHAVTVNKSDVTG